MEVTTALSLIRPLINKLIKGPIKKLSRSTGAEIKMIASNIPMMDEESKSDPYMRISEMKEGKWEYVCSTKTIQNCADLQWEPLYINRNLKTNLLFEVYDEDKKKDDFICSFEERMDNIKSGAAYPCGKSTMIRMDTIEKYTLPVKVLIWTLLAAIVAYHLLPSRTREELEDVASSTLREKLKSYLKH